jgi:hypothetical protein
VGGEVSGQSIAMEDCDAVNDLPLALQQKREALCAMPLMFTVYSIEFRV